MLSNVRMFDEEREEAETLLRPHSNQGVRAQISSHLFLRIFNLPATSLAMVCIPGQDSICHPRKDGSNKESEQSFGALMCRRVINSKMRSFFVHHLGKST